MNQSKYHDDKDIAVIGMACEFPGASDYQRFWWNLREGVETISQLAPEEIEEIPGLTFDPSDRDYVRAAAILEDADMFDAAFFGFSAREAELMDPQQRVFLQCAWHALEDAGYDPGTYKGSIGVFGGARSNTYLANIYSHPEVLNTGGYFEIGLGNDLAFLTSRISHRLGLRGPSVSVHTACSTGLVAVHLALRSLHAGECQIALAGGVAVNVPQKCGYRYQRGGILSPDGHCRAFDADAAGTVFGSGVGIVVLKRAKEAIADGDSLHALIKGSAVNNDGSLKAGFTAPSVNGQAEVIRLAMQDAGVSPDSIGYVEAHGTGTQMGDPIEIRALTKAFLSLTDKPIHCAIGSVKTNIGHLDAAAGLAGLIKTILMLRFHKIPPLLHFSRPNPQIDLINGPFFVHERLAEWRSNGLPRRAAVSAFGVGGTNAHVVLEEATGQRSSGASRSSHLLPLSAKSNAALDLRIRDLGRYFRQEETAPLADIAFTLAIGRAEQECRAAAVCDTTEEAILELDRIANHSQKRMPTEQLERPVIFMLPGQGVQQVNVARNLYDQDQAFRCAFDDAAAVASQYLQIDLRKVMYPEPELAAEMNARLARTSLTQPVLFVLEYALISYWKSLGVRPEALIGHSLGEYVAACLAGVFNLSDALMLVTQRGLLMERAMEGAMLAVSMREPETHRFLDDRVSLAAVNTPDQCVLSGARDAIEMIEVELSRQNIAHRRLKTSCAFHSLLMDPVAEDFRKIIASVPLHPPQLKYVSNVSGEWVTAEQATNPDYWVRHIRETVQFYKGLQTIFADFNPLLLDVGPGRILSRFARSVQENPSAIVSMFGDRNGTDADQHSALTTLGGLWLGGATVDWGQHFQGETRSRVHLPGYPFARQRYWIGPSKRSTGVQEDSASSATKSTSVRDWFYLPSWKLDILPEKPERKTETYLVFADTLGIAEVVTGSLLDEGHRVVKVTPGDLFHVQNSDKVTILLSDPTSYDHLVEHLLSHDLLPSRILHLWSTTEAGDGGGPSAFETMQLFGYYSVLWLCQALHRRLPRHSVELLIAANRMCDPYDEAAIEPEKGTLSALCLVIPQEESTLSLRCVDFPILNYGLRESRAALDLLMSEVKRTSKDKIVALRGCNRWVRTYSPVSIEERHVGERTLREGGVYLITGGLGRIGLLVASHLAQKVNAKLVLLSRSTLPEEDTWEEYIQQAAPDDPVRSQLIALRGLKSAGTELITLTANVANESEMKTALDRARTRFGHIDGVLHLAGVTSGTSLYRSFTELPKSAIEEQFGPKVYGVYVLDKLLRDTPLDFCVLFSSNAAILGGLGYTGYAAANCFMDAFATAKGRRSPWMSVDWDPWPLETKKHASLRTATDMYAMTAEESLFALDILVSHAISGHVIVATGSLDKRLDLWTSEVKVATSNQYPRPSLETEYVAPRSETEKQVAAIWQQLLGVSEIGVNDDFFDLGGHSLLAVRLMGRIRDELGIDIPLATLFESPTIAEIATLIQPNPEDNEDDGRQEALRILAELS